MLETTCGWDPLIHCRLQDEPSSSVSAHVACIGRPPRWRGQIWWKTSVRLVKSPRHLRSQYFSHEMRKLKSYNRLQELPSFPSFPMAFLACSQPFPIISHGFPHGFPRFRQEGLRPNGLLVGHRHPLAARGGAEARPRGDAGDRGMDHHGAAAADGKKRDTGDMYDMIIYDIYIYYIYIYVCIIYIYISYICISYIYV